MPPATGDDGGIMVPVFPRAPFADDLHVATFETRNEFDVVVRNVWGSEDLAHRSRGCGGDEFALLEQQEIAQELAHGGGVRVATDGIGIALVAFAIMFPHPNPAA